MNMIADAAIAASEAGMAVRWHAPGLAIAPAAAAAPASPPSVEALQALEESARADGYARGLAEGHAEGLASGQAEARRMLAQIEGLLDGFIRPLARLDDEVAEALGELAARIAGALVGRAYRIDPTLLADLVREALDAVGSGNRELELRLHADDFGVLAPHLAGLDGVRLTIDNGLGRGELRLNADGVRIDGTLAARLQTVLDTLLDAAPAEAVGP